MNLSQTTISKILTRQIARWRGEEVYEATDNLSAVRGTTCC